METGNRTNISLKIAQAMEIKEQLIGQCQISMEDSQIQMVNLLASEIQGDVEEFYKYPEKIKKVKLKDVRELAKKVADGDYSFFALVPG